MRFIPDNPCKCEESAAARIFPSRPMEFEPLTENQYAGRRIGAVYFPPFRAFEEGEADKKSEFLRVQRERMGHKFSGNPEWRVC